MDSRYKINRKNLYESLSRWGLAPFFVILFVFMIYICSEAAGHNDLNRILQQSVKELNIPGAVMMVESPDGGVWYYKAGVRQIGSRKPMSRNLKFRIGSITKTFVASVVLMLASEGKVQLDTEVYNILPGIVSRDKHITVRHLLQMRSSLKNFTEDAQFLKLFRERPWMHWTPEHLLSFGNEVYHRSGRKFEYNNSNYVLLGLIVEKLTGDSFEDQVYKRILAPLKLKSTSFPVKSANISEPYAHGHDFNPQTDKIKDFSLLINPSWAWCSGNGVSTVSDMMKWSKAYLNGYGIDKSLFAEQMDFQPITQNISYGLGMMNKYEAVGHNGNFAGIYTAVAYRYNGYFFVILTNGQAEGGGRKATAESVFWQLVERSALFNKSKS
ncbi:class A beta-lactamase-related serine hydrolase [Marinifilum sp. JC120]|nr:class A beta-lactamase-related serine hydrolase [Marinifilum sp. JC120]